MPLNFECFVSKPLPFFAEKMGGTFAVPHCFSAKNISILDYLLTRRLKESLTNDFVKLMKLLEQNSFLQYRIRGNFRGLPFFAVFCGQSESAKLKIAKYIPLLR